MKSPENPENIPKNTPSNIQLEDLNILITVFKRREENIIQLLDLRVKSKKTKGHDEGMQVRLLNEQIQEIELNRAEKEDMILIKYCDHIVCEHKQKR